MTSDGGETRRVTLPPTGLLAGAVGLGLLVVMVALLVLVLLSLGSLESSVQRTNEGLERSNERFAHLNREVDPVAELSPRFLRRAVPYLDATREDLERVSDTVPEVERALDAVAAAVIPAVDELRGTPLTATLSHARNALVDIERLSLLRDADGALELVPDIADSVRVLPEVRDSIDTLQEHFRDVLTVLCSTNEHISSIDRKTGGNLNDPAPQRPPPPCRRPEPGGR